jgi:hypothetical protein
MEEVEKKRQTVEELYSLRNATIEEEEAIRRNIKSSFKDIEAEYLSASIHPENDNNIVLMIKSGFTKRYDQVVQGTAHFLTMNLDMCFFRMKSIRGAFTEHAPRFGFVQTARWRHAPLTCYRPRQA